MNGLTDCEHGVATVRCALRSSFSRIDCVWFTGGTHCCTIPSSVEISELLTSSERAYQFFSAVMFMFSGHFYCARAGLSSLLVVLSLSRVSVPSAAIVESGCVSAPSAGVFGV